MTERSDTARSTHRSRSNQSPSVKAPTGAFFVPDILKKRMPPATYVRGSDEYVGMTILSRGLSFKEMIRLSSEWILFRASVEKTSNFSSYLGFPRRNLITVSGVKNLDWSCQSCFSESAARLLFEWSFRYFLRKVKLPVTILDALELLLGLRQAQVFL